MSFAPRLVPALILAATLAASASGRAAEPEAVATAPVATSGAPTSAPVPGGPTPSVADQIETYLKTSPAAVLPKDDISGITAGSLAHGTVDIAVGTNGYRSAFVQSDLPIGKTGTLSIAVGETRFNGRGGYGYGGRYAPGYGQTLALGLRLDDAAPDPRDLRCRHAEEGGPDRGIGPQFEGGRPSGCQAAGARTSP